MNSSSEQHPESQAGFWKRLFATPLSDLFRGRITGHGDWRILLAEANLPAEVRRAVANLVRKLPRRRRTPQSKRLIEWASQRLAAGHSAETAIQPLGNPSGLAALLRSGAELQPLLNDPLPPVLFDATGRFVTRSRLRRPRRRALIEQLLQHFRIRLAEGDSVESLSTTFGESIALPELVRRTHAASPLFDAQLPPAVTQTVHEVVRRTRLRMSEKTDVARELITHFQDGLAAGHSFTELIESFGPPKLAARLIRRSRLRCRPLYWQVWRRTWQATGLCAALLIVVWGALIVRFHLAQPNITFDPVADLDAAASGIPVEERAWPLYREGLLRLGPTQRESFGDPLIDIHQALLTGPESEDWPTARTFLENHRDSVELFLQAAERSRLGFIHRDPENADWLKWCGRTDGSSYNPPGTPAWAIILEHLQQLRLVAELLSSTIFEAAERGDADTVASGFEAWFQLAEHAGEVGFVISRLVAIAHVRLASERIAFVLANHPELLDRDQLQMLQERLRIALGDDWELDWEENIQLLNEDFLQHSYSPDGRFTADGLVYLRSYAAATGADLGLDYVPFEGHLDDTDSPRDQLVFNLLGCETAAWIADRPEMEQLMDELVLLYLKEVQAREWHADSSSYNQRMQEIRSTWTLHRRFLPVLASLDYGFLEISEARAYQIRARRAQLARDAALVAIALEQHRRDHGRYPESLTDLVPEYSDAVPTDAFADQPLRYSLVDDTPHLYSLGPDRDDDGGIPLSREDEADPNADGDWLLLPVHLD